MKCSRCGSLLEQTVSGQTPAHTIDTCFYHLSLKLAARDAELTACKRAKAENDERYLTERDAARSELAQAHATIERMRDYWLGYLEHEEDFAECEAELNEALAASREPEPAAEQTSETCGADITLRDDEHRTLVCTLARGHAGAHHDATYDGSSWADAKTQAAEQTSEVALTTVGDAAVPSPVRSRNPALSTPGGGSEEPGASHAEPEQTSEASGAVPAAIASSGRADLHAGPEIPERAGTSHAAADGASEGSAVCEMCGGAGTLRTAFESCACTECWGSGKRRPNARVQRGIPRTNDDSGRRGNIHGKPPPEPDDVEDLRAAVKPTAHGGRGIPRTEDDGERRGNIHPAAQVRKICPCETLVEEPGPHIPECPYSDPDYEPAAQGGRGPCTCGDPFREAPGCPRIGR